MNILLILLCVVQIKGKWLPFSRAIPTCAAEIPVIKKTNFCQSYSLEAAAVNEGMTSDTIHEDIEVARQLLGKTQEQFDKLEFQVSRKKISSMIDDSEM